MVNHILVEVLCVLATPGIPFARFLEKFKQRGTQLEFLIWSTVFGVIIWAFVVLGGIWVYNYLSI